jgi:uncharacterized protein with GYD domain
MPKYVMLSTLTPKGSQTLQANPDRLKEVNRDLNIVEAPDALTMARVSLALGGRGSMRFQTYELVEVDDLLENLSA